MEITLQTSVLEMSSWNLGLATGCPETYQGFPQTLEVNFAREILNRKFFPHSHLIPCYVYTVTRLHKE
jgi:hypothetical protein